MPTRCEHGKVLFDSWRECDKCVRIHLEISNSAQIDRIAAATIRRPDPPSYSQQSSDKVRAHLATAKRCLSVRDFEAVYQQLEVARGVAPDKAEIYDLWAEALQAQRRLGLAQAMAKKALDYEYSMERALRCARLTDPSGRAAALRGLTEKMPSQSLVVMTLMRESLALPPGFRNLPTPYELVEMLTRASGEDPNRLKQLLEECAQLSGMIEPYRRELRATGNSAVLKWKKQKQEEERVRAVQESERLEALKVKHAAQEEAERLKRKKEDDARRRRERIEGLVERVKSTSWLLLGLMFAGVGPAILYWVMQSEVVTSPMDASIWNPLKRVTLVPALTWVLAAGSGKILSGDKTEPWLVLFITAFLLMLVTPVLGFLSYLLVMVSKAFVDLGWTGLKDAELALYPVLAVLGVSGFRSNNRS